MRHRQCIHFLLLLLAAIAASLECSQSVQAETPAERAARLAWWREGRFGMFIHWGPVSLQGTEIGWSRAGERRGYPYGKGTEVPVDVYDSLYRSFNPTAYDPDAWVALAKSAGMKYVVLTSRHHDGFSLFDTRASDYRITSAESPYGKDIVKPLADACHRAGLHFGIYYSQPDWHSPDAFTPQGHARYQAYLKAQLTELLSQFGAVDLLFFDGLSGTDADYDGAGLIALARRLQPQIIINNRTGLPADYDTPEQTIGGFQLDRPWETCMTLGDQWSYKPNDRIKSLETCIRTLARCAGGDGNLLLNVGPTPSGVIEPGQADRLREVGAWLAKHGESIYGTRGGPFPPTAAYVTTRAGRSVYVHVFEWQGDRVALPAIGARVVSASVLGGGAAACEATSEGLTLTVPASAHELIDTIIKLELDREAATLPPAVR